MKKNKKNPFFIALIVFLLIIIITFIIYVLYSSSNNETLKEFNKEGYDSTNSDIFYKKIVTNNTLNDYYKDIENNQNSQYQEYYFKKNSTDYIELKMIYNNGVSTSLNIVSNLKNNETEFNYELSYKDAHLILQGNNSNNYECQVIKKYKISVETSSKYCDMIKDEINEFNLEKEKILKNEKIKSLIK